jgi:head-tail adaptor
MSLQSVTSIHEVWVLEPSRQRDANGGILLTYMRTRSYPARVCPVDAKTAADLFIRSVIVSHKIYLSVDPGNISENMRLEYNGTVLNVTGPVINVNGLDRLWIVYADARGRYNPSTELIE